LVDVEGGHYQTSNLLHTLDDGDVFRIYFTLIQRNPDPEHHWLNSVGVHVGRSVFWLNYKKGKLIADTKTSTGIQIIGNRPFYKIKNGENYIDIIRRKNYLEMSLNGESVIEYQQNPPTSAPEEWSIFFKVVGYKLKYRTERQKSIKIAQGNTKPIRTEKYNPQEMRIIDTIEPGYVAESPVLGSLGDGQTIRVFFEYLAKYRDKTSADVGFNLNDKRVYIRDFGKGYFADPDNLGKDSTVGLTPVKLKSGLNYVDYKRQGNNVKVTLNGNLIKDFTFYPEMDQKVDWNLRLRAFGAKVKYKAKKL
jgi:hypothetical protein